MEHTKHTRSPIRYAIVSLAALAIAITSCSEAAKSPTGPAALTPALNVTPALTLTGDDIKKCEAAVEPDWLCQSETIRKELCGLLTTGGKVDIKFTIGRFTVAYRVTFKPKIIEKGVPADVEVFIERYVGGTLVPLGKPFVIPAAKVAELCPVVECDPLKECEVVPELPPPK